MSRFDRTTCAMCNRFTVSEYPQLSQQGWGYCAAKLHPVPHDHPECVLYGKARNQSARVKWLETAPQPVAKLAK